MKRLLGYLRKHLEVTILAPVFKMLEASFELGREQDEEHGLVMTDQRTYEIVRQFLYGIYS